MNLFEQIKEAVPVWEAAETYGLEVNRNKMTRCPFHGDRNPSLKLNDTYYYCFGCGVHGDVIDFTARYFDLKPYEAAKKLVSDFGLYPDPDTPLQVRAKQIPYAKTKAFREEAQFCFRVLTQYLHLLEDWKTNYAPASPREPMDERYIEACQMLESTSYLVYVLTFGDEEEQAKKTAELIAGGKMEALQAYLERRKDIHHEEAA